MSEETKTSSLTKIRQEVAASGENVSVGFGTSHAFDLIQRIGIMFSKSDLVPKQYIGNIGNCVIALNMASRIGADPLMVMQNLYVVRGRPSWSAQFLIATFNSCGRFSALRYEWVGKEGTNDWGCRAWANEKSTGEKLYGSTITIGLAKKEGWHDKDGSKWQTMPQQMLMYRAASWFVRAYAPELAMGLHTVEEAYDIGDREPEFVTSLDSLRRPEDPAGPTVDMETGEVTMPPEPKREPVAAAPAAAPTPSNTWDNVPPPTKEEKVVPQGLFNQPGPDTAATAGEVV